MKLSIIIPVYNVEKYLRKCLDSAVRPDDDYELIVVNDGSTDASPAIAEEYAQKYPELIRVISTPNGGLGHARSTGLSAARGEYVLFLDSDDSLADGAVGEMLETARADFDICFFDFISVDEAGRQLKYTRGCEKEGEFTLAAYPELLFCPPNACTKLFRRSLFADNGVAFPDRLWFEDLATIPMLYIHARKIISVPRPWYIYLQRPGSITNAKNADRNLDIISAVDRTLDCYKRHGVFSRYKPELEYMAAFHELITASVRVNLIDRRSAVQERLLEDFTAKFPDYRSNRYIRDMSRKYRLLLFLITHRLRLALNLIMRLNRLLKRTG